MFLESPAYQGIEEARYGREQGAGRVDGLLIGPAPCDECQYRAACLDGLACADFAAFVATGKVLDTGRTPRREIFARLYGWFGDMKR